MLKKIIFSIFIIITVCQPLTAQKFVSSKTKMAKAQTRFVRLYGRLLKKAYFDFDAKKIETLSEYDPRCSEYYSFLIDLMKQLETRNDINSIELLKNINSYFFHNLCKFISNSNIAQEDQMLLLEIVRSLYHFKVPAQSQIVSDQTEIMNQTLINQVQDQATTQTVAPKLVYQRPFANDISYLMISIIGYIKNDDSEIQKIEHLNFVLHDLQKKFAGHLKTYPDVKVTDGEINLLLEMIKNNALNNNEKFSDIYPRAHYFIRHVLPAIVIGLFIVLTVYAIKTGYDKALSAKKHIDELRKHPEIAGQLVGEALQNAAIMPFRYIIGLYKGALFGKDNPPDPSTIGAPPPPSQPLNDDERNARETHCNIPDYSRVKPKLPTGCGSGLLDLIVPHDAGFWNMVKRYNQHAIRWNTNHNNDLVPLLDESTGKIRSTNSTL